MTRLLFKKLLLMVTFFIFAAILVSCGFKEGESESDELNKKTTYKYDNDRVMDEVTITKSVYTDEKLIIYISGLKDCMALVTYDENFNCLKNDFDYKCRNGKLIIKGEDTRKISGIDIKVSSDQKIKLRYLDSKQYAILIDYFVDDLGTETYGDLEAYYTEEERVAQQAAKDEKISRKEENYKAVEGYWQSVEDNGEYVYIYTNENGEMRLRQASFYNDELNINDTYICSIEISEIGIDNYYAYYELEILDSEGWGCAYYFDLNEDMTAIMDWNTENARYIKVEGMIPDDLTVN